MSIDLDIKSLFSRRIRFFSAKGKRGLDLLGTLSGVPDHDKYLRKIDKLTALASKQDKGSGLFGFLWDKTASFVGWITSSALKFLSFSATAIWQWIISGVEKIKAFNWGATDAQLKEAIDGQNVTLATIWGSFLGQGFGWLSGIAVGSGVAFLCPVIGGAALSRYVIAHAGEEALEELLPQFRNAIAATIGSFAQRQLIEFYINFRWFLKGFDEKTLTAIYGKDTADFIRKIWGKSGSPNLSFNYQMEEAIESIQNKEWKAFIESFLEESWDSFMEAGFIVASTIDEGYAQAKHANKSALGTPRTVEIELDSKADSKNVEKLKVVALPQTQAIPAIEQTLNTYRMIHNRDMGMVMGLPLEEYTRAKPQSLRIVIDLYNRSEPPYFRKTENFVWATITIPDAKRSAIDWEKIKLAVGGKNGYLWGRFRAIANLSTGRKMMLYGASEQEARDRIMALLSLTDAELLTLNITEEVKAGERLKKNKLQKEVTRVYPGYMTILNRKEILDQTQGHANTRQRNYRDAKIRIPLWTQTAPSDFKETVSEIMTHGF